MAAPTSPHRCVLESRRLLYHRSRRQQADLMPTVSITFCVCARSQQPAERRRSGRLRARLPAAPPEAGAESLRQAQRRAGGGGEVAKNTQSRALRSVPWNLTQLREARGVQARWRGSSHRLSLLRAAYWRPRTCTRSSWLAWASARTPPRIRSWSCYSSYRAHGAWFWAAVCCSQSPCSWFSGPGVPTLGPRSDTLCKI